MPSQFPQSTPTKPMRPGNGKSVSPAKFSPSSPDTSRYLPLGLIGVGSATPNNDAKEIVERRRARQSMTPTKPVAKFDSICQDSKSILHNMAGMFSPKKGETEALEVSPFKIEVEAPPVGFPVIKKSQRGKDRRDYLQRKKGQERKRKLVNPGRIRRPTHSPADLIPEGGDSKHRQ